MPRPGPDLARAGPAQFVAQNDEARARQALARRLEKEKLAESLERQFAQSEETTARLRRQLESLRDRLADARRHLASLMVRQRAAEARRQFVQALGHFDADLEAFRRFDELSQRVEETEAEVDAECELYRNRSRRAQSRQTRPRSGNRSRADDCSSRINRRNRQRHGPNQGG